MTKDEIKNKISMALKDPVLQQGFEIICKDLAISEHDREHNDYELAEVYKQVKELKEENVELKADNDARKFAMAMSEKVEKQLRKENAELKDFINAPLTKGRTTTRKEMFQSIWKLSKKLSAAKDLLKRWVDDRVYTVSEQKDLIVDTEQFLEEE